MHVRLIAIGSVKNAWLRTGCQEYVKRIQRSFAFELLELPASKQRDSEKQKEEECERILKTLLNNSGENWILDERGIEWSSHVFSSSLQKKKDIGVSVNFVLGGAYGLNNLVRKKANVVLALSAMTFPHELCRLLFLEQLYRVGEIHKGSGYHH